MRTRERAKLIRAAKKVARLTNGKLQPVIPEVNDFTQEQNCWGYTAQALGLEPDPAWLYQEEMIAYLAEHTVPVTDIPRLGDIAVYTREYEGLIHTSIIIDPKKLIVLHKPGTWPVELSGLLDSYEGSNITFARPKVLLQE